MGREGETVRLPPPALPSGRLRASGRELLDKGGELGGLRCLGGVAEREDAGLVRAGVAGDEVAPVEGAEKGPDGDGGDVGAGGAGLQGGLPDVVEPKDLVFDGAGDVGFRDGDRKVVALPGLGKDGSGAGDAVGIDAKGFDVDEGLLTGVSAGEACGIEVGAVVEKAVAGEVVVEAEDVGRAGIVGEPEYVCFGDAVFEEIGEEGVLAIDMAAEEIDAKPAAVLAEEAVGFELRCGPGFAAVFGMDELGLGIHRADGLHGEGGGFDLVDERVDVAADGVVMGIPVAVETAEARGGLRFVDGGVAVDPGVALGDLEGVGGEFGGEFRVEQVGFRRTAAMVDEAGDRSDAESLHVGKGFVKGLEGAGGSEALPVQGIAKGTDAQGGEAFQVRSDASEVSGLLELVEKDIADTVDGRFHSAPEFEGSLGFDGGGHIRRMRAAAPAGLRLGAVVEEGFVDQHLEVGLVAETLALGL